jgi:phosphoglycerate dehydrogenase-like enzyme
MAAMMDWLDRSRILVTNPDVGDAMALLRQRLPHAAIKVVSRMDALADAVASHRPHVVFSFRFGAMTPANSGVLFSCPETVWFHNGGAGINHLPPWDATRITLTNSGGVLSDFMAEYVMGGILSLNFGLPLYRDNQRERIWRPEPWTGVRGKTLLILGIGNIGQRIAARAKAFGMRTIGFNSSGKPVANLDRIVGRADLPAAMAEADVVSVHVPLTQATAGLLDRNLLENLKPGAILVNSSRGGVVDEVAVADRLRDGKIKAALFDVFSTEPLPADSPLWDVPNLFITPHSSELVDDWQEHIVAFFCDNLERLRTGQPLLNVMQAERQS